METAVKSGCETCAFREGCVTSREPYNVLRSEICVLAGIPFFCHHATDLHKKRRHRNFKSIEAALAEARRFKAELRQNGICQGWKARVRKLVDEGWFDKNRGFRRAIGTHALDLLEEWVGMKDGPARQLVHIKLHDATRIIAHPKLAPKRGAA